MVKEFFASPRYRVPGSSIGYTNAYLLFLTAPFVSTCHLFINTFILLTSIFDLCSVCLCQGRTPNSGFSVTGPTTIGSFFFFYYYTIGIKLSLF